MDNLPNHKPTAGACRGMKVCNTRPAAAGKRMRRNNIMISQEKGDFPSASVGKNKRGSPGTIKIAIGDPGELQGEQSARRHGKQKKADLYIWRQVKHSCNGEAKDGNDDEV